VAAPVLSLSYSRAVLPSQHLWLHSLFTDRGDAMELSIKTSILGQFTFCLSLLPRLSPSPKFRPRPKSAKKLSLFFVWTRQSLSN